MFSHNVILLFFRKTLLLETNIANKMWVYFNFVFVFFQAGYHQWRFGTELPSEHTAITTFRIPILMFQKIKDISRKCVYTTLIYIFFYCSILIAFNCSDETLRRPEAPHLGHPLHRVSSRLQMRNLRTVRRRWRATAAAAAPTATTAASAASGGDNWRVSALQSVRHEEEHQRTGKKYPRGSILWFLCLFFFRMQFRAVPYSVASGSGQKKSEKKPEW